MIQLSDGRINNEELILAFMKDGYLHFIIDTRNPTIPKEKYVVSVFIGNQNINLIKSYIKQS